MTHSEKIVFADEKPGDVSTPSEQWKLLVVDDEEDVHAVTWLALKRETFNGRGLHILDAYSAEEGRHIFQEHPDIAVVLLDVVMETSSAGLDFVKYIREQLENHFVRIILRTGQPGYAPEHDVVVEYDIDDYKTKSELTASKLFTVVYSGLRTYHAFVTINDYQHSLEQKVKERTLALEHQTQELRHEVIKRQQAEVTLQTLNEQLQAANASKNTFFSIISHDLRSPFAGFLDITRLMAANIERWDTEKFKETVSQLKEVGENLYALLENLLTWARIQQDTINYFPQQFNVHSIVARSINLVNPHASHKQLHIQNTVPYDIMVYADLNMVNTVVRNLISNAVKFTEIGGNITISAVTDREFLTISVSDTGIGLSEENMVKMFRIDTRCQRLGTNKEPGTGLGLVLCKEFVERNGGRIWVESHVGNGTTFSFTLPEAPS